MTFLLFAAMLGAGECEDAQVQVDRVSAAIEQSDFEGAGKLFEPVEYLSFRCPNVMVAAGRLAFAKGDYRGANLYSELAVRNAPDSAPALLLRGKVMSSAGQSAA